MVGDDASKLRSMLEVNYPMENGIVRYGQKQNEMVKNKECVMVCDAYSSSFSEIGKTCVMYGITHLVLRK